MSHNTATGQGSVFNVGNAELVSFTNVTFEENSGAPCVCLTCGVYVSQMLCVCITTRASDVCQCR